MTEMFGEAWSPMSVPDLAPDDDDDDIALEIRVMSGININCISSLDVEWNEKIPRERSMGI